MTKAMNATDVDTPVIIIGAGPAGLMAARRLAREDIDFILLSKETEVPGERKTCGGLIPLRSAEEFGLVSFKGAHHIRSLRIKFPGLVIKRVDFNRSVGIIASRADIGVALLSKVSRQAGSILLGNNVETVEIESNNVKVTVNEAGEKRSLRAHMVIDASGAIPVSSRNSLVRSRLEQQLMIGYGVQYQLRLPGKKLNADVSDIYYGHEYSPGGYAWVFPRGNNEAAIGTGGLLSKVRAVKRSTFEYLDYLMTNVEPTCSELKGAEIIKREAALMPLAGVVKPSYADRILLAGDAAAHCSPISGEGIYYSMVAGDLAAATAIKALHSKSFSSRTLSEYERAWTRAFGSDLKWGRWLQKRLVNGGIRGLGSKFLEGEKGPRIIAEMLLGERSVRSTIVAVGPGYLKAKILKR